MAISIQASNTNSFSLLNIQALRNLSLSLSLSHRMTKNPWLVEKQVCWLWYWLLCQFWYSQFKLWELSLQGRKIKSTRKAITFLSLPTQLILIKIHGNFLISLWNLIYFIICFWSPNWTRAWNLIFFLIFLIFILLIWF